MLLFFIFLNFKKRLINPIYSCLVDQSTVISTYFNNTILGDIFNADEQCKLIYGTFSVANICQVNFFDN